MMIRSVWIAVSIGCVAAFAAPLAAQQQVPVQFAKGASSRAITGTLKGDVFRDYLVNARAGQTINVSMKASNPSAYFNVMPPGSQGEAQFVGSTSGASYSGPVQASGNTIVRVYLMRNAGRRGESTNYTLNIGVSGVSGG